MLKSIIIVLFFVTAIYATAGSCQNSYLCSASAAVATLAADEVVDSETLSVVGEEEEEVQALEEENTLQLTSAKPTTRKEVIPPLGYRITKDSAGVQWCVSSCEWFADRPIRRMMNQTVPKYSINNGQICSQCAKPYLWYKLSDLAPKTTCFSIQDIQSGVLTIDSLNAYKAQCSEPNAKCRCASSPIKAESNITLLQNNYQEVQPLQISSIGADMNSTVYSLMSSALELFSTQSQQFSIDYSAWHGKFSKVFNNLKQIADKFKNGKAKSLKKQWKSSYKLVKAEKRQYNDIHYPYFYAGKAYDVTLNFLNKQYTDYISVLNSLIAGNIDSAAAQNTLALMQRYQKDLASVQQKLNKHYHGDFDKVITAHGKPFSKMLSEIEALGAMFL